MIEQDKLARVAVIGTSCSGKTTFARRLAQHIGMPQVELDAFHWGPNWTPRPAEEFELAVRHAVAEPRWICDGNYSLVRHLIWPRATAVVWLDLPFRVVFGRAICRSLRRCVDGAPVCGSNRESFSRTLLNWESIPLWVMRTYGRRRRDYPRLLANSRCRHLHVVRCRTTRQVERLLQELAPASRPGHRQSVLPASAAAHSTPNRHTQ